MFLNSGYNKCISYLQSVCVCIYIYGFLGGIVVKNPPANAGDARNKDSISRLGRFLEKEIAVHSSILVWKIPWTEEPSRLQSIGLKRIGHE